MTAAPGGPAKTSSSFFDTLRGSILVSIPALSALTFVIVAVKVFRASGMEATTTVAIVSSADVVALLKGVVLTLLPGFLSAVTAAAMWWWADLLPRRDAAADEDPTLGRDTARRALWSPQAAFAWSMSVVAFFTISWPIFLALVVPVVYATVVLAREVRRGRYRPEVGTRVRRALKGVGGTAALVSIAFLTLAPSVWLPLRTITVAPGQVVVAKDETMPDQFAAYVLSSDDSSVSLLLARPRAVVEVAADDIADERPLCVTPEAPTRAFYLRPSQVLGLDPDDHSPYPLCPELDYQSIFGT